MAQFRGIFILVFVVVFSSQTVHAGAGYCSFIGANTAVALQQTQRLIAELRSLKESKHCNISGASLNSLTRVEKYFDYYLTNKNPEYAMLAKQAEFEKLQEAYNLETNEDMKASLLTSMISAKTYQIEAEALASVSKEQAKDFLIINSIQDLGSQLVNVVSVLGNYESCFDESPVKAAAILTGIVNVAGSVASIATVNPLWAGVGGVVGSIITAIGQGIRNYKWRFIAKLDKTALFYDFMCMIEMQSNFYCANMDEIKIIKDLMISDITGDGVDTGSVWDGFEIQTRANPAIQGWIKNLYYGSAPSSIDEAESQNRLVKKVADAEVIQNTVLGYYKELLEKVDEGGNRYVLLQTYVNIMSHPMIGSEKMNNGGYQYFTEEFLAAMIPFVLVTPKDKPVPTGLPPCFNGEEQCDMTSRFRGYIRDNYSLTDQIKLQMAINRVGINMSMIFSLVNKAIDRDLIKRRLGDPAVLLSKAETKTSPTDVSPKEGLKKVELFLDKTIVILRKHLDFHGPLSDCERFKGTENKSMWIAFAPEFENHLDFQIIDYLGMGDDFKKREFNKNSDWGCPVQLQLTVETKRIVSSIIENLANYQIAPIERVKKISEILKLNTNRTLLYVAKMLEVLKANLIAQIDLKMLSPTEEGVIYLKKEAMLKRLQKSGLENDKGLAIDDRQKAQEVITRNLQAYHHIDALKGLIFREISRLKREAANGTFSNADTYAEACTIMLSLPYRYGSGTYDQMRQICYGAFLRSEWNKILVDQLGLEEVENLNVKVAEKRRLPFLERVCTYRTYQKRNAVYGLRKKKIKK